MGPLSLIGDVVILLGVSFEFFADRDMHRFLASGTKGAVCDMGLCILPKENIKVTNTS